MSQSQDGTSNRSRSSSGSGSSSISSPVLAAMAMGNEVESNVVFKEEPFEYSEYSEYSEYGPPSATYDTHYYHNHHNHYSHPSVPSSSSPLTDPNIQPSLTIFAPPPLYLASSSSSSSSPSLHHIPHRLHQHQHQRHHTPSLNTYTMPENKFSSEPGQQAPSSGKAPRSWVPRACDRCRKRKARCDQQVPCRNCAEAGVTCTHDAPVLKRGPRPKPRNRDVESRLRNLESLLASISNGNQSAAVSLSRRELDQIRVAAHLTPGPDTSPSSEDNANVNATNASANSAANSATPWGASTPTDANATPTAIKQGTPVPMPPTPMPNNQPTPNMPNAGVDYAQPMMFDPFGVPIQAQQRQQMPGNMVSGMNQTLGPAVNDPTLYNGSVKSPNASTGAAIPAKGGKDLLYRDAEGQTKWLGPSSGMPLLERLKVNGAWAPPLDDNGNSMTDEWMSLTNAIGVDPASSSLNEFGSANPSAAVSPSSANDDFIWERVLAVVPPDLIDSLVRSYFTISHLLWPILHAPTFMQSYVDPELRKNPSFVALVLSICSLSSRYTPDERLRQVTAKGNTLAYDLIDLAKDICAQASAERSDLYIVQALFNLSVVQEGMARSNQLWSFLSQGVSIALDLGLHRRKDEYNFTAVELEEQKRTFWALYCQTVQASCTYGRPPMLRLIDIELDEPAAVDDVYISVDGGIGTQPPDRPSVMAGFVAGVRLHMILERTVRRVNSVQRQQDDSNPSFIDLVFGGTMRTYRIADELELLPHVTDGLVGDWSFSPSTVSDSDSVRFFQRTRVFTLQQFIRLMSARHRFTELLGTPDGPSAPGRADEQAILQQITQSALGIIGTYSIIDTQARLDYFGAHAISQLTQAGAGLIGVILHVRSTQASGGDSVLQVALQGLCASIVVLRKLGQRRPAGNRSAELLLEFARACRIMIPGLPDAESQPSTANVEVPMLRALPRRANSSMAPTADLSQAQFDEWLGIALQGAPDVWMGATPDTSGFTPDQNNFAL